MKRKVLYIISNIDKAQEFEWVIDYLDKSKFQLNLVMLNPDTDSYLSTYAKKAGIDVVDVVYRGKKHLLSAFFKVYRTIKHFKPHIVHCHLPEATLVGLFASKMAGTKQRVYTRHHSTFNHQYHPHAVKYDKCCNSWATDIIAITNNVKKVLVEKEGANPIKITTIPHCIDVEAFNMVEEHRINGLLKKHAIDKNEQHPIVGIISRYTEWKGVQYIVPAFKRLLKIFPNACLVLAGGRKADYTEKIKALLATLPKKNYIEIDFESDLFALHKCFDVFVHTPIDEYCEAFGQIYIEAMAARTPSIFTKSGIAYDIAKHEKNCLVVSFKNSNDIYDGLLRLLNDSDLQKKISANAYILVSKKFDLMKKIKSIESLYQKNSPKSVK